MTVERNMMGVGPKLAILSAPVLAGAIAATVLYHDLFRFSFLPRALTLVAGALLVAVGLVFYAATARLFLREFKTGRLITTGTFALCRNPIYASFIVFLVPGAGLLCDSWLIAAWSLALYGGMKLFIGEEYRELEAAFGAEARRYAEEVNEVLPLPRLRRGSWRERRSTQDLHSASA